MFIDEVPHDFIQHGIPHGTNIVSDGFVVDVRVHERIYRGGGGVGDLSDASRCACCPRCDDTVCSSSLATVHIDCDCHEVTPAFAHAIRFEGVETGCVGWAASETVGETVGVFVAHDVGVETGVSERGCAVGSSPEVHSHPA